MNKMKDILKGENMPKLIILIGILLICLIFISGTFDIFSKNKSEPENETQLEKRVANIISCIEGSKGDRPQVLIRLDKDAIKVIGAAIVCSSARDPIYREKVIECVSKTLNVSIADICVTY